MDKKFTWVQTHKELVDWLKDKQNRQQEMIELLKKAGVKTKVDRLEENGEFVEVDEIDPFTFFTQIYRHGGNSLKIIQFIAKYLGLSIPEDIDGIPHIYPMGSWLFPFKYERKDEVRKLWDFFYKTIENQITDSDFDEILKIKNIAKTRLTEVLFLVAPEHYLPINAPVIKYLDEVLSINHNFKTFSDYMKILEQVKQKDPRPYYEISFYAHNYRVFAETIEQIPKQIVENFIILLRKFFNELNISKGDTKINLIANKKDKKLYCKIGNIYCASAYANYKGAHYGVISTELISDFFDSKFKKYGYYNYFPDIKPIEQNWNKVIDAARYLYESVNPSEHDILHNPYFEDLVFNDLPITINQHKMQDKHNHPLNLILYGPPGTGKTFHTIKIAAEIIENRPIDDYDKARDVFNEHLGGRIRFITFHQSYSYQDFVQGIRPNVNNENSLTFKQEDGIFMQIAIDALFEFYKVAKKKDETTGKPDETGDNLEDLDITEKKKRLNNADINELRKIAKDAVPNYVLIIDEINRANISNVFGELITLLEPDKRSHGKNTLIATLPSSGDQFVVPSNLYIIGTMNTADKSIALLDVALRRRFIFKPMYPQYDLQDLNDVEVLKAINEQIIREKGKDFQIGHSYFLGKDGEYDFEQVMNQKVIPLLLEYFMNDEEKVREILQEALKHKPGYVLADSKDEKYKWLPIQIVKE